MSTFDKLAAGANAAVLTTFGEVITYIPQKGTGVPFTTMAVLDKPEIDQSAAPGYFADIRLDPLQVTSPLRGDLVVWTDGLTYTVSKVIRPDPYGLFIAAIHRSFDS